MKQIDKDVVMKKILFLGLISCLTQVSALTHKSGKASNYCEQSVYAHGILLKAQIECGYRKNNNKLISSSTPGSYTHLDVYKRQITDCARANCEYDIIDGYTQCFGNISKTI